MGHDDGSPRFLERRKGYDNYATRDELNEEHKVRRAAIERLDASDGILRVDQARLDARVTDIDRRVTRLEEDEVRGELSKQCEARSTDARQYAASIVKASKAEAREMVDKLAAEWSRIRTEERDDRRQAATAMMWRIGLMVTGIVALVNLAFQIWGKK